MNSLTGAICYYLGQQAGVTALASSRIYKSRRPQRGDWPAITIADISGSTGQHQTAADGIATARLQIDCWATSHSAAESLRDAVYDVTDGKGTAAIGPSGAQVTVIDIETENLAVEQLAPADGGQSGDYRGRLDLKINYRRTAPTF